MKWNAIITKSQYERTLQREKEITPARPNTPEEDELRLLRMLIRDYEERQFEIQSARFQITKNLAGGGYPGFL